MKKSLILSLLICLSTATLFAAKHEKCGVSKETVSVSIHTDVIAVATVSVFNADHFVIQKDFVTPLKINTMFFELPDVEAKYINKNGDADPVVQVVLSYKGKLSKVPMIFADKIFAGGGHIALKADQPKEEIKTDSKKIASAGTIDKAGS